MGWVGGVLLVPTPSMWGPGRPSLAGRGTNFLVELLVGGVRSAGWQRSKKCSYVGAILARECRSEVICDGKTRARIPPPV